MAGSLGHVSSGLLLLLLIGQLTQVSADATCDSPHGCSDESALLQKEISLKELWGEKELTDEEATANEDWLNKMEDGVSDDEYEGLKKKRADAEQKKRDEQQEADLKEAEADLVEAEKNEALAKKQEEEGLDWSSRTSATTIAAFKGMTNEEVDKQIMEMTKGAKGDKKELMARNLKTEKPIDPDWVCDPERDGQYCNHRAWIETKNGNTVKATINIFGAVVDGPLELMFPGEDVNNAQFIAHNQAAIAKNGAERDARLRNLAKKNYIKRTNGGEVSPMEWFLNGGMSHMYDAPEHAHGPQRHIEIDHSSN